MPLKFGVVREDPEIEATLVEQTGARAILLVASGGCTALTLAKRKPDLAITAFDLNPLQLEHVRNKAHAAARGDAMELARLGQAGEFEGLFRLMRATVEELVAPRDEIERYFDGNVEWARGWLGARYWPAVFATVFNDPLLHAMFGPEATQHAEPGSYPGYFQRAFERGLLRDDGPQNPFLQHVLESGYRKPPEWLGAPVPALELVEGTLAEVRELGRFDVISLSNVFDWSDDALLADWGGRLAQHAKPGAAVILRQLNNRREVAGFFPGFRFDDALGRTLQERDRSLFYERILIAFKI